MNKQKKKPGCLTVIIILFVLGLIGSHGRNTRTETAEHELTPSVKEVPVSVSVTETDTILPETEPITEIITETDTVLPETSVIPSDIVTPEFKEAMDNYKVFFEKYAEFMAVYSTSQNPMELLGQYTEFMLKYTEAMQKLEAIDETTLSPADDAYYLETMLYIDNLLLNSSVHLTES